MKKFFITLISIGTIAIATAQPAAKQGKSTSKQNSITKTAITMTKYTTSHVSFTSGNLQVKGLLFMPNDGKKNHPGMVIIGPVAYVKEQAPLQYATRLASAGFATLIFDPRYHGESEGEPRRHESGKSKTEDIIAGFDFLQKQPGVDAQNLHMVAVCQGVNWGVRAANTDKRIKSLSLIAGHYLSRATAEMYNDGAEQLDKRIARAVKAKEDFDKTGVAEYIKVVKEGDNDDAHLPYHAPVTNWYLLWSYRIPAFDYKGLWENRIALMSEAELWTNQVDKELAQLTVPVLMVHANRAATGIELPKQYFNMIPSKDKKLVWLGNEFQLQFYEDPITIDKAVGAVTEFQHHLQH